MKEELLGSRIQEKEPVYIPSCIKWHHAVKSELFNQYSVRAHYHKRQ